MANVYADPAALARLLRECHRALCGAHIPGLPSRVRRAVAELEGRPAPSGRRRYEVQTSTICDGWTNCWHDEHDAPLTFATRKAAAAALAEHLADCAEAGMDYSAEDYRIVPCAPDLEP